MQTVQIKKASTILRLVLLVLLYIAVFCGILCLFLTLAIIRLLPLKERRLPRAVLRSFLKLFRWSISILGFVKADISGVRPDSFMDGQGTGTLILANHPGLLDALLLLSFLPDTVCLGKEQLRENSVLKLIFETLGFISNSANLDVIGLCTQTLKSGKNLLLFPEGTRSPEGEVGKFSRSPALIALRSGARLLPVIIRYSAPLLDKRAPWFSAAFNPVEIDLEFKPYFEFKAGDRDERENSLDLTQNLQRYFSTHI